jgi:hypothetical protein
MEKQEVFKILVFIELIYPKFKLKNEVVEKWFRTCGTIDSTLVMENLNAHIRKYPFPPLMEDIILYSPTFQARPLSLLSAEYTIA